MSADDHTYAEQLINALRSIPLVKSVKLYPSDSASIQTLNDVTVQAVLKTAYVDKKRKKCKITIHCRTSRPTQLECAHVLRTRLQTEYALEIAASANGESATNKRIDDNLFLAGFEARECHCGTAMDS